MLEIKKLSAEKMSEKFDIPQSKIVTLFDEGIINENNAIKFLVRQEYNEVRPSKGNKMQTMEKLADEFCISLASVRVYLNK